MSSTPSPAPAQPVARGAEKPAAKAAEKPVKAEKPDKPSGKPVE
jgi:hypothetical protein